ncbi:hypothetical protein BH11PLA2_BH11PLA2_36570 [soil metagenome]
MALFDMFTGEGKTFGAHEGFAGILLAAAAADGHISDSEGQALWRAVERMKLFSNYSPEKFGRMMDSLVKILKKGGPEALVEKCVPAIPERLRATAFTNAVDIVLADGEVEDDEEELIEKLQTNRG